MDLKTAPSRKMLVQDPLIRPNELIQYSLCDPGLDRQKNRVNGILRSTKVLDSSENHMERKTVMATNLLFHGGDRFDIVKVSVIGECSTLPVKPKDI